MGRETRERLRQSARKRQEENQYVVVEESEIKKYLTQATEAGDPVLFIIPYCETEKDYSDYADVAKSLIDYEIRDVRSHVYRRQVPAEQAGGIRGDVPSGHSRMDININILSDEIMAGRKKLAGIFEAADLNMLNQRLLTDKYKFNNFQVASFSNIVVINSEKKVVLIYLIINIDEHGEIRYATPIKRLPQGSGGALLISKMFLDAPTTPPTPPPDSNT